MSETTGPTGQLIYGYPPGASGSKLANALLPLVVLQGGARYDLTNLEGRSTRTASIAAARAKPDGVVLLQAISASLTLMPSLHKNLGFDPFQDFKPIASLGDFPYVLVIGPIVPRTVTNIKEYLDWLSDNPDFRNIGISVNGSVGQLAVQTLANITGASLRSQSYQGTEDVLRDLRSQVLAAAFIVPNLNVSPSSEAPIRPIGITSAQRFSYWPHVVPLADQGISAMDLKGWFGWFTQSATPESALTTLRAAVIKMQASDRYANVLRSLLLTANSLPPAQITARMHSEFDHYRQMVALLKIPIAE
ncbi:Bug family tripartite tricarboxylate transporter substrate binding protein [Pseudomonas syringae group genomosp. 3]|uniref:Bug family tripartite tricarboxylate transporter substrate binding protein n=1 Tax=Pseudomonas syringae group genomosp. 3 TaxID=251701 RepID=UPI000EFEBECE|nr:tripartite tricarboxylate transporter substrate-binding protein [Pseudomonas syringae group genomosp. 3]RMP68455.1 hypothetical protein ALQ19_200009 [Pseudomonas syringae pv. berberidis]